MEAGKLLGVRQIVAGEVGKIGKLYTVSIRLIDVETGKLIKTATEDCECPIETVVTQSLQNIAQILSGPTVQKSAYHSKSSSSKNLNEDDSSTDIKEWELKGISRDEYITYKRSGLDIEKWKEFNVEYRKNTPIKNSLLSILIPGLGQFKLKQKRVYLYLRLDIFCIWSAFHYNSVKADYSNKSQTEENHYRDVADTYTVLVPIIHLISSVDAGFSVFKYRKDLEKKYNVNFTLDYNNFYKTPTVSLKIRL